MTIEAFVPATNYSISGTGPYAINHPFRAAEDIAVSVIDNGNIAALSSGDWSVSPTGPADSGAVTLSASAAATFAGKTLRIDRATAIEQGFVGATAREKGVEEQLDTLTMGLQDVTERAGRALVIQRGNGNTPEIQAIDPDHTIIGAPGGGFVQGPSKGEIEASAANAAISTSAAAAALSSQESAAASSAAAGAASGRLDVGSFAELASVFVYSAPGAGQQIAADGDVVLWRGMGFNYRVEESGATDFDLDYTGTGGVKLSVLPTASGAYNVLAFGAVNDGTDPDTGTDNAPFFQKAADKGGTMYIPGTGYRTSDVTFSKNGQEVLGDGMGQTAIFPASGSSAFIIATDNVYMHDFEFRGKTGTGQFDGIGGDCIKFDAVTNNPAFARHMEGCKIERVKFRNLKFNAINVTHLLRESIIRECRFVGMGDNATNRHAIRLENTLGNASNINNLWIDTNHFYRAATEAVKGYRSPLLAGSAGSFAEIRFTNNQVHGQLLDESGAAAVEPEQTNQFTLQDAISCYVSGNNFTSLHPLYQAVNVTNVGTFGKTIIVSDNRMATKETIDGTTYSRSGPYYANGEYVNIVGVEAINVTNNALYGGVLVRDIFLSNGDLTSKISVCVTGNTTQAGAVLVDHSALGSIDSGWNGVIDSEDLSETTQDLNLSGTLDIVADGTSSIERDGNALALLLKYDAVTSGAYIGSPGANRLQFSSSGGSPLIVVDSTDAIRPGSDNSMALGSASYRFTQLFAGTASINTSDVNQKQDFAAITAAEKAVALACKALIQKYRWKDAVADKGDAARTHIGPVAQDVAQAFTDAGLDPYAYGIVCSDTWPDVYEDTYEDVAVLDGDGNPTGKTDLKVTGSTLVREAGSAMGLRLTELTLFILAAL